jgi:hypothetical protein
MQRNLTTTVRARVAQYLRRRGADGDDARARVQQLEAVLDHERLYPVQWAHRRVRDAFGYTVLNGPFAGLVYPQPIALEVEAYSAKLLGTYENELHDAVETLLAPPPATVVNIGASDGYYAVGLARRLPGVTVHAFDTNEAHHPTLRLIADANGVDERLEIAGTCDAATLDSLATDALVVCDCEGCELTVLDPALAPNLRTARLLVECHDLIDERITAALTTRFAPTHDLEIIAAQPRWVRDHPELSFLPVVTQQLAITEFREGPMHWMVARPRP